MAKHIQLNRRIATAIALVIWLVSALPLLAQYEQWLQEARRAYQAGDYEQCINNCMIYSSMNVSTVKDELQVKAERMLACKAAGTLNAYRYMVQYNPHDTWAQEHLQKAETESSNHDYCVFFQPGKRDFDGSQSDNLNHIAAACQRDNNAYEIVGYYTEETNKSIIKERIRLIYKTLTEKGIPDKRLSLYTLNSALATDDNTRFLNEAVIIKRTESIVSTAPSSVTSSNQDTSKKTSASDAPSTNRSEQAVASASTQPATSGVKEAISAHWSFKDYIRDVEDESGFGVSFNYGTKSIYLFNINYTWSNFMIYGGMGYYNGKKHDYGDNTTIRARSLIHVGPGFYTKFFSLGCSIGYCVGEVETKTHTANNDNGSNVVTTSTTKSTEGFFCYKPSISGYIPIADDKFISVSVGYLGVPKVKDFNCFTFGIGFQVIW